LITRVGKLELRIPQDRTGRFSNGGSEIFNGTKVNKKSLSRADEAPKGMAINEAAHPISEIVIENFFRLSGDVQDRTGYCLCVDSRVLDLRGDMGCPGQARRRIPDAPPTAGALRQVT
jgi:hypothetical protein